MAMVEDLRKNGEAMAANAVVAAIPGHSTGLGSVDHMHDAINSLRIVLGADQRIRTGQIVTL